MKLVAALRWAGDLAQLVCGDVTGGNGAYNRTAFVFRGMALGDLALAALAYLKHQGADVPA